jgi:hypothetical protein
MNWRDAYHDIPGLWHCSVARQMDMNVSEEKCLVPWRRRQSSETLVPTYQTAIQQKNSEVCSTNLHSREGGRCHMFAWTEANHDSVGPETELTRRFRRRTDIHSRGYGVLAWLTFRPWRWRRYLPPERRDLSELHGDIAQKAMCFIFTAMRTSQVSGSP